MSKDNTNLRLLGSPVNLSYRGKKKDDRKNIRNRPRSALQNSCFTPDYQEGYKRPFSADAKEPPLTRNFFKTFSSEVLQSYHISDSPVNTIKILPPTTELLDDSKAINHSVGKDKELCSNASDYGSEDTFISLGTKIKAKAQLNGSKVKSPNKNILKYRNIAKKGKKLMDSNTSEDNSHEYNMEIKFTERSRPQSPVRNKNSYDRSDKGLLLPYTRPSYESFFIPLQGARKGNEDTLAGRVSFGSSSVQAEVEQAIDTYTCSLTLTKQQLSLVEEESTQDIENVSHQLSSLSPDNSLEGKKANDRLEEDSTGRNAYIVEGDLTGRKTYMVDKDNPFPKAQNFINETRTYNSFYDDFQTTLDPYKSKSSTVVHTDASSKDSGYTESGTNDDKKYSLPCTAVIKSNSPDKIDDPKSFDSISTTIDKGYKTFPPDKTKWTEPLNHSRLLYKDFFLKKEGHIALPPQNSPIQSVVNNIPGASENAEEMKEKDSENLDYPPYLLNSSSKAYTSKVIEDYKKELEAINSLHELTIKDIQTDAISPTPLNIDKMFEQNTITFKDKDNQDDLVKKSEVRRNSTEVSHNKNSLNTADKDISKVSTKELIQNYFKVKEADYTKDYSTNKNIKKNDKKISNSTTKIDFNSGYNHDWNNKTARSNSAKTLPINIKNQTHKNMFTLRAPVSARIESVQTDKDIDSWMSLSEPSPRVHKIDDTEASVEEINRKNCEESNSIAEEKSEKQIHHETHNEPQASTSSETKEAQRIKELSSNSTVLDIYSMLKEIESFGEMPVTSVTNTEVQDTATTNVKNEETTKVPTPRDNFTEIFEFLEKVEQSANDALSVVTTTTPQTIPKLEALLKLPHTELAQRLVTLSLQLEERSCCIALLQESLTNNKQQMMSKVSNLEKQSMRNIAKVKQECEETIKRHQNFIDQLINDKKTLNHRIEQLVDERRSLEERWKRSAQALEERYKLELRNQHDKMAAAQQVARQRWVRQKAEKIKELTVKGLEGELREMAERQQKEISDIKMYHAEQLGRMQAKQTNELEELRRSLEEEKEVALVKERQLGSSRLEKQILELELTYQEQRTRLVAEMRAENERVASGLSERERAQKEEIEKWREEEEKILSEKRVQLEQHIAKEKEKLEEQMKQRERELEKQYEQYRKDFEAEQQLALKRKVTEIAAQHKQERDREIERAIESMEAEAQAGRKELQDALRRNKEQYETELKELGETERATLRRYQDAQARIRQTEDKCAEMEVMINQLETRNKVLTEKTSSLSSELEQARARCDAAWRLTVDNMRKEVEDLKKTHEEQMHQLYAKVKVAVARKDSAIQALTREAAKYQEKITTLEQKLQQQRKDFLQRK